MEKSLPAARLEPVAFGFVVRCLTDGAIRLHMFNGILNIYKEGKHALRILGKVYIEFHRIFQHAYANIFFIVW